jgi:predicted GH43/DUF377 family glycosyl hydrolase
MKFILAPLIPQSATNPRTLVRSKFPVCSHVWYLWILLSLSLCCQLHGIDLEDMVQNFVLQTKQIRIPEYPHAFNPSIIRWNGSLLMCFRFIPNPNTPFNSEIGLVWLDDNFNPVGNIHLLDTRGPLLISSRVEDPRLVKIGNSLYVVYSNNVEEKITKGGFRVFIAQLNFDGKDFSLRNIECLSKFEGASQNRREKNWVPFEYHSELLVAYTLSPHCILRPLPGTNACETFCTTSQSIPWEWGELRGGTCALIDSNKYLAFFHSSKIMATVHSNEEAISHYFIGAYTFSLEPPFEITHISPEPIVGKNFYHGTIYKPYWGSMRVVFPGGFIFDDQNIWIAYGRQDHEIWIVKLDKQGLLQSLIPVSSHKSINRKVS